LRIAVIDKSFYSKKLILFCFGNEIDHVDQFGATNSSTALNKCIRIF